MDNTVNIGLFLDTRRELVKQGAGIFGVKADLRYMGRRWQFATPFTMTQSEWDSLENRKIRSDALKEKTLQLDEYRLKALNIIDSLHPFVFEKFKQLLSGKGEFTKPDNRDVYRLFRVAEERFELANKPRTAAVYQSARRSLEHFRIPQLRQAKIALQSEQIQRIYNRNSLVISFGSQYTLLWLRYLDLHNRLYNNYLTTISNSELFNYSIMCQIVHSYLKTIAMVE